MIARGKYQPLGLLCWILYGVGGGPLPQLLLREFSESREKKHLHAPPSYLPTVGDQQNQKEKAKTRDGIGSPECVGRNQNLKGNFRPRRTTILGCTNVHNYHAPLILYPPPLLFREIQGDTEIERRAFQRADAQQIIRSTVDGKSVVDGWCGWGVSTSRD